MTQLELLPAAKNMKGMLQAVHDALSDGRWWTLPELAARCGSGGVGTGLSARVRELRGLPWCLNIQSRVRKEKLWEYRMK